MPSSFDPKSDLRSPRELLGGYLFLPRLIDKVRLHTKGLLPASYHENLLAKTERTFDGRFLLYTGLGPEELRGMILSATEDAEVLRWVEQKSLPHSKEEIQVWSALQLSVLSIPTEERIAMRRTFYPEVGEALGPTLLGSMNPCDLIDFDEGRMTFDELRKNHEARIQGESRPPHPPFSREAALQKVRMAEDAWNTRNPEKVAFAYTVDSRWRNRNEFLSGRGEIVQFLARKWKKELDYRLIKELWAVEGARIAVRFAYEWHDDSGQWFRSYGNENWEFTPNGLMAGRLASINDLPITEEERKFRWPPGPRPVDHPGLSELGL